MKHIHFHPFIVVLLLSYAFVNPVSAQGTSGKIAGYVYDAINNQPLIGANVLIEGTNIGAATDAEGFFYIINVPPGVYTLRASMIGYSTSRITNVRVSIDLTTDLVFRLHDEAVEMEEVVVTAERPMIQRDLTASMQSLDSAELQAAPIDNLTDIMEMMAGITLVDPIQRHDLVSDLPGDGLHIRGGRENETVFLIDGVRIDNPLYGGASFSQNNFGTAINEMMTVLGTFNAEYGGRMSGVINLVTREAGDRLHTEARFFTDKIGISSIDRNTFQGDINISGPFPFYNKLSFVGNIQYRTTDGRFRAYDVPYWTDSKGQVPIFDENGNPVGREISADWKDEWHGLFKVIWRPATTIRLMSSYIHSRVRDIRYRHEYKFLPYGMPWTDTMSDGILLKLTHQFHQSTYYELYGSAKRIHYWSGVHPVREQRLLMLSRESDAIYDFEYAGARQHFRADTSLTYQLSFNITSQVTPIHLLKTGVEYRYMDLFHRWDLSWTDPVYNKVIGIDDNGEAIVETYENHRAYANGNPIELTAYLQDKMEFVSIGMVINLGVRWEMWDVRDKYMADPTLPAETPLVRTSPKSRFSPRLGISYPISDRAAFHFAYGHFYQYPNYVNLLASKNEHGEDPERPNFQDIGIAIHNANINPEKSVTYETGVQLGLFQDLSLQITAYYRELADLIGVTWIRPVGYVYYDNVDFGNSRGLELTLIKHMSHNFSVRANYSWSQTSISTSSPVVAAQAIGAPIAYRTFLADWDRTHDFAASARVRLPHGVRVSISTQMRSGRPYTLLAETPNTERMPTYINFNGRISKSFNAFGIAPTVYLQVFNIFDRKNIYWVYPVTGKWDDDGDPGTSYVRTANPNRLSDGRRLRLGISFSI
jgi:hypothetical protein